MKLGGGVAMSGIIRRSPIGMGMSDKLSIDHMGMYKKRCICYIAYKKRQQKHRYDPSYDFLVVPHILQIDCKDNINSALFKMGMS